MTKNLGAEIEVGARCTVLCAHCRLVKASSKVEVDSAAAEKLCVSRADSCTRLKTTSNPPSAQLRSSLEGDVFKRIG